LCLAPEGPLEDVRVLTPGEADTSSLAFARTGTQPMGAWALLRQAKVIGWNGNYPLILQSGSKNRSRRKWQKT
jgi:hypothetical protein